MDVNKKMTGKDISTEALLAAIGDNANNATFTQIASALGLSGDSRALDGALQREKRAGRIRFEQARRCWVPVSGDVATNPAKSKRSGRAA